MEKIRYMAGLFLLLISQTVFAADEGLKEYTMSNITKSVTQSLFEIVTAFVDHIPYFVAATIVLLGTWVMALVTVASVERLMRRSELRRSP